MDSRVIKSIRSLQQAGFAVTLFCLAAERVDMPLPDLQGATVRWVQATRPLATLATFLTRGIGQLSALRKPRTRLPRGSGSHRTSPARSAEEPRHRRGWRGDSRAILGTLWLNLALARAAASTSPAIIHANDADTLPAGALLCWLSKGALIYDSHELYPDMHAGVSPLYSGLWRLMEHYLIRSTSAVITVNGSIARELRQRHRLATTPTVVMNCPLLEPLPTPSTTPQALAQDLPTLSANPDQEPIKLLYHGRFLAERGLEELVYAMDGVDQRVVLYLRGDGPLHNRLQEVALAQGLGDRLRFLPPVAPDSVVTALAGFSIGIVPYTATSLNNYLCTPNKLFDYLMGGLAVVASDLPELRRIVAGKGIGLVYRTGDIPALVAAINTLATTPSLLHQCQESARQAAVQLYNWERQEVHLRETYNSVLLRSAWAVEQYRPPFEV